MSFDWIGKTLYFVDGQKKTIELVRTAIHFAGKMRKTILDKRVLKKPRGVVVHPKEGVLFYSDWDDSKPHIGRANMDGSDQKVLFGAPNVQWPNGLSTDPLTSRCDNLGAFLYSFLPIGSFVLVKYVSNKRQLNHGVMHISMNISLINAMTV